MSIRRRLFVLASLVVVASFAAAAQPKRTGLMGDLLADVTDVEGKIVSLAKAMPEASYAWRPMPGVRSVGEAFTHVAADNYFLLIALGATAPAPTRAATRSRRPGASSSDAELAEVMIHVLVDEHAPVGVRQGAKGRVWHEAV